MTSDTYKSPGLYIIVALVRILLLVLLTLALLPVATFVYLMRWSWWSALLARFFYGSMRYICGVRLTIEGEVSKMRPLMLVSNHSSYLDIFILGSLVPLSFTPKKEIRSWPIIGFMCILADCIFIDRKPADMQRVRGEMAKRLSNRKVICLFPEGTTGDGLHVMPFKSGFFSLAENFNLPVQPVSLAYTHIGNMRLNSENRDLVAWIGEASLVTHLTRLLSFRCVRVTVTLYPVELISQHADRKSLARKAQEVITVGLKNTLERNGVTS